MKDNVKDFMKKAENGLKISIKSGELASLMEWDKYMGLIPAISFPPEWKIKIIPPFCGAMVRFLAIYKNEDISVYLDCSSALGFYGEDMKTPYWEAYSIDGNTFRCGMDKVDELIDAMKEEFKRREEKEKEGRVKDEQD